MIGPYIRYGTGVFFFHAARLPEGEKKKSKTTTRKRARDSPHFPERRPFGHCATATAAAGASGAYYYYYIILLSRRRVEAVRRRCVKYDSGPNSMPAGTRFSPPPPPPPHPPNIDSAEDAINVRRYLFEYYIFTRNNDSRSELHRIKRHCRFDAVYKIYANI